MVRARDEGLDVDVALKVLAPEHAADLEVRERFVREARLLRRVRADAVVRVHDVGETPDRRPYLVMELAEGGSLRDRLGGAAADTEGLRAVVATLADGLGALHAAGIVHRDITPGNLLVVRDRAHGGPARTGAVLGPGERLVIGDLGLAKDQTVTAYGPTMVGGTPRFRAPEQVEVGGRVDARTDVYAATAVLWHALTGSPPPTSDELPVAVRGLPASWQAVMARGLDPEPDGRFATIAEWAAAIGPVLSENRGGPVVPLPYSPAATLPYKGLAAFQPGDAALFFGRDDLVEQLVARVAQRPVLVVGGPSGSGKSSLVRAGLLARLAAGALPGSAQWSVAVLTPGDRPMTALRTALATPRQLVFVDQLEELFTLCNDQAERAEFLGELADLPQVVLAVRADFYGSCAAHPWLATAINDNQVLVGFLDPDQLREAVQGPARRVGLHLEPGLVERIVADAGTDGGALPLVAHALVETWLRREGDLLTLRGYQAAGGVTGAIGHTADQVWAQLDHDDRQLARRMLPRMVRVGAGSLADTKRLLRWEDVGQDPQLRRVLDRFADSRLLTSDETGVQLAHEALLRTWGRLAGWLDDDRDDLRAGGRLEDAAGEWEASDRLTDLLPRGVPLANALAWRDRRGDVDGPVGAFLAAAEESAANEHDVQLRQQERAHRQRRRVLAGLSTLTALAVLTSVLAVLATRQARDDSRAAQEADAVARTQVARSLAATASGLTHDNPFLATVLAAEAMTRADTPLPEARSALASARLALAGDRPVPYGDPIPVGDAQVLTVTPDGSRVATGNRDGSVDVWAAVGGGRTARLTGPRKTALQGLAYTADARWLVGTTVDGGLWRWDASVGDSVATELARLGSIAWGVAAAPTGNTVVAVTTSGVIWPYDAATGQPVGDSIRTTAGELEAVAFSPDGSTLLAGSLKGQVLAWSWPARTPRWPALTATTSHVLEIAVSGGRFVTTSSDGTAAVWDLATSARVTVGPFDADPGGRAVPLGVRGVTFGPNPGVLTMGDSAGAVRSWSLTSRTEVDVSGEAHRDRVIASGRSRDGTVLVTLSDDRTLQVWSERTRPSPIATLTRLDTLPASFSLSPDAGTLAVGGADGTVRLLDARTGAERARLAPGGTVTALTWSSGALISGGSDGVVRRWDPATWRETGSRQVHRGAVSALATDGELLVSGGADRRVALSRPDSLDPVGTPAAMATAVTAVAVDGDIVVGATDGGDIRRWDRQGVQIGTDVRVVDDTIRAVAVRGSWVAVARADEVLTLLQVGGSSLTPVHQLGSHTGGALDVAFLDATTVAVTAADGSAHLWDVSSGSPVGPTLELQREVPVWHVLAAPDGQLWTAGRDGTISRVDGLLSVPTACAQAAGSFDTRQRQRLLAGELPQACPT